ncbi:porin family protein [Crenothrix sp.]|uniref:porin family protein n=1 Tax=Crenothrix sp. TaxID=3100433 RepID=UPI00374CA255
MIKKTNTRLLAAAISMIIAGSLVTSDAMAKKRHKHHKRHHASKTHSTREYSSYSSSSSSETNSKVDALEAQMRAMQDELSALRANGGPAAGSADAAKVQELDQWMQDAKANPPKVVHDNHLFFRGGYAHQNNDRGGTLDPTNVPGVGSSRDGVAVGPISDSDAWYFGAGFDFGLTNDVWGILDNTDVFAELNFDYTELGKNANNGLSPAEVAVISGLGINLPAANTEKATVNMLRLSASPKIKFLKSSAFRPWIIPVGFELSIISPPSDAITVLTPGMVFGLGADYRVWKNIFVGADARYHYAPGNVDGVNVNGVTAGGYLGIGF